MAVFRAYASVDILDPSVWYGYVSYADHWQIQVSDGWGTWQNYYGSFWYDGFGELYAGTIRRANGYEDYVKTWELSDGSWSAVTWDRYLAHGDADGLTRWVLGGDDVVVGSAWGDRLGGFGGDDAIDGGGGADRIEGGVGIDELWGGTGDDTIVGGADGDWLIGEGGRDVLTGGSGADRFRYDAIGQGRDRITDFRSGVDRLEFRTAAVGLPVGQVAAGRFRAGPSVAAMDAGDRLFFNTRNRTLYFDRDGSGAASPVAIATFDGTATLRARDILVVG